MCFDVYLETETENSALEGPVEFAKEKIFPRLTRYVYHLSRDTEFFGGLTSVRVAEWLVSIKDCGSAGRQFTSTLNLTRTTVTFHPVGHDWVTMDDDLSLT